MKKINFEDALKFIKPKTNYWCYSDIVDSSFKVIPKIKNNVIIIVDMDEFDVCFDKDDSYYITKSNMLKIRSIDDGNCQLVEWSKKLI
jgi:hypothetical protein